MKLKLRRDRIARVERFRMWKKEKKDWCFCEIELEKTGGYELCGSGAGRLNESGKCCLLSAWRQCRWSEVPFRIGGFC